MINHKFELINKVIIIIIDYILVTDEICGMNIVECADDKLVEYATKYTPILIFFLAQCLEGVSTSIYYTIGTTYLDDNVKKETYPLYYGNSQFLSFFSSIEYFFVGC